MNKRVLGGLGVVGGVLGLVVVGGGMALKGRVLDKLTAELTASVDANVAIGDANASFWTSFPAIGVHLTDVTVDGVADFEGERLLSAGEISIYVDVFSAFSGDSVTIDGFAMRDASVHVIVDDEGRMNTDIVAAGDDEGDSGTTELRLESVDLEQFDFRYEDRAGGTDVTLVGMNHSSAGGISGDVASLDTETTIDALTAYAGGITWLGEVETGLTGAVAYNLATGGLDLQNAKLSLNALDIGLDGGFVPSGDDYDIKLAYETADSSFKTLLSILPAAYTEDFAGVDATGTFTLKGTATGLYATEGDNLPAFDLLIDVPESRVQYPDLPSAVEGLSAKVQVSHPQGPTDAVIVDVERFGFTLDGHELEGRLGVKHPTTDPDIDLMLKGDLNLGALSKAWPMPGKEYAGDMKLDLELGGRQSAFEGTRVGDITARGKSVISGLVYTSADSADPLYVDTLIFKATPQHVEVTDLALRTGSSDIRGVGFLEHPVAYALGRGNLTGQFSMRGKRLDLDEMSAGGDTESTEDDGALVTVPTDLDLVIGSKFDTLVAQGVEVEQMRGDLIVRDGAITMRDVQVSMLGGRVELNGSYTAPTAEVADLDLRIAAIDLDMVRTFEAFPALGRILPAAVGAKGLFDSGIQMKGRLGPDGGLVLESLASDGSVLTRGLQVVPGSLTKLAEKLGKTEFGRVDLDGAKIFFSMLDGNLVVKPSALRIGSASTMLHGGVGVLAQTLDLKMDMAVPTQALAGSPLLGGKTLPIGQTTLVRVGLGGGWDDPKITTDLAATAGDVARAVVTEAVGEVAGDAIAEASARGDALIAEAKVQAAEVRKAAATAAAAVRKEAKKAGDALIAEATNPITKKVAEKAAEKLGVDADKQATRLETEADTQATALVSAAERKKAELVASAGR
ncbi:MAG: hypothetical protein KC912_05855 [Proteobacteria bacterium]|nr:hypothetical protein [Pseudomonadota bacterium]